MEYSLRQVVGIIIWWTEGTKAYRDKRCKSWIYPVDVTNTNPEIIQSFLDFLRKDIGITEMRLKLQLQIHYGDNQEEIEDYWSKATKIPRERFTKTIIRQTDPSKATKFTRKCVKVSGKQTGHGVTANILSSKLCSFRWVSLSEY